MKTLKWLTFYFCFVSVFSICGCSRFEDWKTGVINNIYGEKSPSVNHQVMTFSLQGDHSIIGVGYKAVREDIVKWNAEVSMNGPQLEQGSDFTINAVIEVVDQDIYRLIHESNSDELYMVAVISPLYNKDGHFRQFSNIQSSCLLTPTGLPIETLQENLPSRYKEAHYTTPWEIVATGKPSDLIKGEKIHFTATSRVPLDLSDGHYRIAFEFGAVIKNRKLKLELVPHFGSILLDEEQSQDVLLTANATERTNIRKIQSPVIRIGNPAPPHMPWTLFGEVLTKGSRGIVANEDKEYFAINYSGLRMDPVIIPMKDRKGAPITYILEPDFPTQNKEQELFEKTIYFNQATVLSHIQLEPINLNYNSGYLEVSVQTPSGTVYTTGKAPFVGNSRVGATTGNRSFEYQFTEYGHHKIIMKGMIKDISGFKYQGGGTYDVWVARPLSMSTSVKPGMPYNVGNAYSPRVTVHPGVPADLEYDVKLYRNSSRDDVKEWKHRGKANRFGYYFPAGEFKPMVFDSPGEYRSTVTASYWDEDGNLWMGAQTSASVVAPADSDIEVHGDAMFFQTRPFDNNVKAFEFSPRYELKASGYAGSNDIKDMTMTQIRMGVPYNNEDMLFFTPGRIENVTETYPLLSFSSSDRNLTEEVLGHFPTFEDFLSKHYGETLNDFEECWGKIYAVDTCDSILLDMVIASIHKGPENLPVMSIGQNDYQPFSFQESPEILNYYYFSAIKPGLLARYVVSDSTNSTAYWIVTPNYFGYQFGAGNNGDVYGDLYHFMGGVVYRNLKTGKNRYGIYHSSGVLDDPRDENNRIEEPLKSPIVKVGGEEYYLLSGMSPEQGALYETGDRIVGGGFIFPSIQTDYEFKLIPPEGEPIHEKGQTNKFGLFKLFKQPYYANTPGLYKVYFKLSSGDKSGGSLGKPDGWYHLYVVEKGSPYELEFDIPQMATFDIKDALEIRGKLPPEWSEGKMYYTVVSPGIVISDGELIVENGEFKYRYVPLHANVFYPSLEIYDIVEYTPAFSDTIVISFFADGRSKKGERITAASEIVVRGNVVFNDKGKKLFGPPPVLSAEKMYGDFSVDTANYYTKTDESEILLNPHELIDKKCHSCHNTINGNRTFGEWRKIVNWHMNRNSLWLRDSSSRNLVESLAKIHGPRDKQTSNSEKELIESGKKLFEKRCISCHPNEPSMDIVRTTNGWRNIIDRHEYWGRKWKNGGMKVYESEAEKETLFEFLNLIAGAEESLPAGDPDSARKQYQKLCFRCHSTILKTYDWEKADRDFLDSHVEAKFTSHEKQKAHSVVRFLLEH